MKVSTLERVMEIARANAIAAIDQAHAYEDSISAYAQNVRDSLNDEGLSEYKNAALAAYYQRVSISLLELDSAPRPTSDTGADSAAAAVNSDGATYNQERYYIENCETGQFLGHNDRWHDEFPEASLFNSWNDAALTVRYSKCIRNTPSETAIRRDLGETT